jgi:ribosomal protein L29
MLDTKKKYGKSADEIMAIVDPKVQRSASWVDTTLSSERARVQRYYDGELPKRQHEGSSSYVSSDVQDGVDTMKSQLLEVFAGGHDIVRFMPRNDAEVDAVRIETAYVAEQIFGQTNHGFDRFNDIIDDGLKNRNGVMQVYWEDCVSRDEHTVEGMPFDDVQALASQEDVELDLELDEGSDPQSPTYSGTWTRIIDNSGLRIENVPPEEYFSEGKKKRRQDGVRGRKTLKTRADLIAEGYPRDKVDAIPVDNEMSLTSEKQERDKEIDDGMPSDAPQPELDTVMLYETFIKLSLNGKGTAALYRIIHAGGQMFEMDEVEEDNFLEFTPLRRPHSQFGNNFAKRIVPTQNARTVLTRGILDHTATTTNPKWMVLNNTLANPRELLNNQLRGIVNVKNREGIAPLPYPNLNPFVFQSIEMLKGNKEETTGLSSLSQGLNKDAISSQNSQGLVNDLVSLSQVRQKIIARNFAVFISDLFLKARKLVLENESRQKLFEFDNDFQKVNPKLWTPSRKVSVSLHVGYGEQEKEAVKFAQLWGMLTQDPAAKMFCPPEKQYTLLRDGMKKNGFANHADYIITPDKVQPPGPDPMEMKKLEIEDKKAQAALLTAQAAMGKAEGHHQIEEMKVQIAALLAHVKETTAQRDADRKDMDIANKVNVSQRETKLLEEAPPAAEKAIVSPA